MLPIVLSIAGGLLPAVIDAFRSGKSPEEAAAIVAPKRREMIDRLTGAGMNGSAAEKMADEAMQGEIEKAQLPEPMNPWLSTALMAAGAYGGFRAGKAIQSARAAKAPATAAPEAAKAPAESPVAKAGPEPRTVDAETMQPESPRLTMGPQYRGKNQGPAPEPRAMDVVVDDLAPFPGRAPRASPEMDPETARLLIASGEQVPGRNTRSFQMIAPVEPARLNGPFPDEFASARTATLEFPPAGPTIVANFGRAARKAADRMRTQIAPAQMDEMRRIKAESEAKIKQAQIDIEYERQKYADLFGG